MPARTWIVVVTLALAWGEARGELTPARWRFAPRPAGAERTFELVNPTPEVVDVTLTISAMIRDLDGGERELAAGDFVVTPARVTMAPGERAPVRVRWHHTTTPSVEQTYQLVARAGRRELGRAVLRVRPRGAVPHVVLASVTAMPRAAGGSLLAVTLENTGAGTAVVERCTLQLAAAPPLELAEVAATEIPAASRRRYVVTTPTRLATLAPRARGRCELAR